MQKIITNYEITATNDPNENKYQETENIIKIPIFKNEEKRIEVFDKKSVEEEKHEIIEEIIRIEPPLPPEPIDPKLHLIRNNDGVVVGIEVYCSCGRYTLIKVEY